MSADKWDSVVFWCCVAGWAFIIYLLSFAGW